MPEDTEKLAELTREFQRLQVMEKQINRASDPASSEELWVDLNRAKQWHKQRQYIGNLVLDSFGDSIKAFLKSEIENGLLMGLEKSFIESQSNSYEFILGFFSDEDLVDLCMKATERLINQTHSDRPFL